jgi:formylglycine-generating enzyme required for sulfatase activity
MIAACAALFASACQRAIPDAQSELEELRRLAAAGDFDRLAELLDHSVISIPTGEFNMGSSSGPADEQPERRIYLDAYQVDRYEVTNAQYRRFVLASGARPPQHWQGDHFPAGQADWPVSGVSWQEASNYCEWAGKRLPSEAEWEHACQGPDEFIYPWGDEWEAQKANTGFELAGQWPPTVEAIWKLLAASPTKETYPHPQPVGSFPQGASAYGVMDLAGNASEWMLDWYNWQGYQELPARNPLGGGPPWNHSVRGSGWVDKHGEQDLAAELSRCARRNSSHTSNDPRLGFRCGSSIP